MPTITDLQQIPVSFTYFKSDGNEVQPDPAGATLVSSNDAVATAVLAPDARSAVIRSGDNLAVDAVATFTLTVISKGNPVTLAFDVSVTAAGSLAITRIEATFGDPTTK